MTTFRPETEIPDSFWLFVARVNGDPDACRQMLIDIGRLEIIALFNAYIDARTELADRVVTEALATSASEDTIDDICDAVVAKGKQAYLDTYYLKRPFPSEEQSEPMKTLVHIFDAVYYDRFGSSPFDELD